MTPRTIQLAVNVALQDHGGGFVVARPFAALGVDVDPFLMIDWFSMSKDPFGPHPHAGFSAVTWPHSEGGVHNRQYEGGLRDEHLRRPQRRLRPLRARRHGALALIPHDGIEPVDAVPRGSTP